MPDHQRTPVALAAERPHRCLGWVVWFGHGGHLRTLTSKEDEHNGYAGSDHCSTNKCAYDKEVDHCDIRVL